MDSIHRLTEEAVVINLVPPCWCHRGRTRSQLSSRTSSDLCDPNQNESSIFHCQDRPTNDNEKSSHPPFCRVGRRAVYSLLRSTFSAWRCRYSCTISSAFFCRLAAIEAIHRCKKLCLIRSLPIKSGEVQTDWIVMGASDTAMLVHSSYRKAVTTLCEVLHGVRDRDGRAPPRHCRAVRAALSHSVCGIGTSRGFPPIRRRRTGRRCDAPLTGAIYYSGVKINRL